MFFLKPLRFLVLIVCVTIGLSTFGQNETVKELDEAVIDPDFQNKAFIKDKRDTSIYAAPECKNEHGYDGFPADIYALGIIFYRLLVSKHPFQKP